MDIEKLFSSLFLTKWWNGIGECVWQVYGNPLPDVASAANVKGIGVNRLLDLLKQAFMQEDGKLPRRAARLAGGAADSASSVPMALEAAPAAAKTALGAMALGGLGKKLAGGLERVVEAVGGDEGGGEGGTMKEAEEEGAHTVRVRRVFGPGNSRAYFFLGVERR